MKALALRLVAFTVVTMAFTLWLGFTIGNIHPFQGSYTLTAEFEDVTGLLRDDNVKVAGVVVGKVTGISVDQGRAIVSFEVRRGVHLSSDTEAAVRWRNLLGQRFVYLYPGRAGTLLEDGDRIRLDHTRHIVDLGELFNRLGPVVRAIDPGEANAFLESVTGALAGNESALSKTVTDLATVAQTLGERDAAIGRLIENAATLSDAVASRDVQIRQILDNLTTVAATFNANTDVLDRAAGDLSTFSGNVSGLLARNRPAIDRTIVNLTTVVGVVRDRLSTVDRTVAGLDELSLSLYGASRFGEWLNQFIPCISIDLTIGEIPYNTGCTSESTAAAGSASAGRGAGAPAPADPVASVLRTVTGDG